MLPRDAIRRDASHGSPERTPLEDAMREHASEAPWLPLCLGWCTEEGFVGGQGTFAHWSGYYERENRDPDNIELAPWVKGRWKGRMKRGRWE